MKLVDALVIVFVLAAVGTSVAQDNAKVDPQGSIESTKEEDKERLSQTHILRAKQLVEGKTAEEFKAVLGQAENHLKMAIEANPENLIGKSKLAVLYMDYADLLEEQSPERLEYLVKADKTFREILEEDTEILAKKSLQLVTLSRSILVRKKLVALAPKAYSIDTEIERAHSTVTVFFEKAKRYKLQDTRLWQVLINTAVDIGQIDFAVDIADQGLKVVESREGRAGIAKAKSMALRRAALAINNFDDFESYKDRFIYLCDAVRAAPTDSSSYLLLLQYVGKENQKPSGKLARQLGLATPGDAVPIKPEWLDRISVEVKYTSFINSLIGLEEFHLGNNEAAIERWRVAQEFDLSTRDLIAKLLEEMLRAKQNKLDHLETILSEFLLVYPEANRVQLLRGLYYIKEKKFQAAIDDFRVVLERKPNEVLLHHRIKACYLFMGQRQAAAQEQKLMDAKIQRMPDAVRVRALEQIRQMEDRQAATR